MDIIPISKSNYASIFNGLNIHLLSEESAGVFWNKNISKTGDQYFDERFSNEVLNKGQQKSIGSWSEGYNNDSKDTLRQEFLNYLDWSKNQKVFFCLSRFEVLMAPWNVFLDNWLLFMELQGECPFLINPESLTDLIVFTPRGFVYLYSLQKTEL